MTLSGNMNQRRAQRNKAQSIPTFAFVPAAGVLAAPLPAGLTGRAGALQKFVRVELYTDGTDEASRRNQQFEEQRFSNVALPFYAVIDPAGERATAQQAGLTRDPGAFVRFLESDRIAPPSASAVALF